jgi:hypothetical protein
VPQQVLRDESIADVIKLHCPPELRLLGGFCLFLLLLLLCGQLCLVVDLLLFLSFCHDQIHLSNRCTLSVPGLIVQGNIIRFIRRRQRISAEASIFLSSRNDLHPSASEGLTPYANVYSRYAREPWARLVSCKS